MSEFDEMDFDGLDSELAESFEGNPDELQPEDVFKMVMLNRVKSTRIEVEIKDEEGDKVDLPELITQILLYVKDRMEDDEGNEITDQLMPLVSQSLVSGLGRMMGIQNTAFLITNEMTRTSLVNMMVIALLLLKFVQENKLTIFTHEEPITQEEMDTLDRKSKASSVATMSSMMGMDPKDVFQEMLKQGKITKQDIVDLTGKSEDDDDEDKDD